MIYVKNWPFFIIFINGKSLYVVSNLGSIVLGDGFGGGGELKAGIGFRHISLYTQVIINVTKLLTNVN